MGTSASGTTIPAGSDVFQPQVDIGVLANSMHGRIHILAVNTAARTALTGTCGWTPSASDPLVVLQTDTQVTWIYNGSAWATMPADTGWVAPTLTNSWVNYEASPTTHHPAAYRVVGSELQIRGFIKNGTTGAAIFTLPAGARPTFSDRFVCEANNGSGTGSATVSVNASGVVQVEQYVGSGGNTYVSLAPIRISLL